MQAAQQRTLLCSQRTLENAQHSSAVDVTSTALQPGQCFQGSARLAVVSAVARPTVVAHVLRAFPAC